ncbi:MAG: CRISPR-associated endonuclease Cas1, partial [Clostridia bacterium]|nr:CRISPR-associated endonuclease Cas1 [Clostridia bacterium]
MKKLLETMYITTPDSYAFLRNENICISVGGEERASVPASQVDSIVFIGKNTVSTALMSFCGKHDITLTFLGTRGEFCGRVCGPVSGNVLLRKRQYESINDPAFVSATVRNILFGKIRNSKDVLMRYARTESDSERAERLYEAAQKLSGMAQMLAQADDVDSMRGIEGAAANAYFSVFDTILDGKNGFVFDVRSKRPPRNEVNAALSFVYTL